MKFIFMLLLTFFSSLSFAQGFLPVAHCTGSMNETPFTVTLHLDTEPYCYQKKSSSILVVDFEEGQQVVYLGLATYDSFTKKIESQSFNLEDGENRKVMKITVDIGQNTQEIETTLELSPEGQTLPVKCQALPREVLCGAL